MDLTQIVLAICGVVLAIIGYFVKHSYDMVSESLKELTAEVRKQNGRIGKLEEWRTNHKEWADDIRMRIDTEVNLLRERSHRHADRIMVLEARLDLEEPDGRKDSK